MFAAVVAGDDDVAVVPASILLHAVGGDVALVVVVRLQLHAAERRDGGERGADAASAHASSQTRITTAAAAATAFSPDVPTVPVCALLPAVGDDVVLVLVVRVQPHAAQRHDGGGDGLGGAAPAPAHASARMRIDPAPSSPPGGDVLEEFDDQFIAVGRIVGIGVAASVDVGGRRDGRGADHGGAVAPGLPSRRPRRRPAAVANHRPRVHFTRLLPYCGGYYQFDENVNTTFIHRYVMLARRQKVSELVGGVGSFLGMGACRNSPDLGISVETEAT